jgi:hypothetical protein
MTACILQDLPARPAPRQYLNDHYLVAAPAPRVQLPTGRDHCLPMASAFLN